MHYELIVLGLVCFMVPALARFAGYETGRKPFDFVGIAGIFFLLGGALAIGLPMVTALAALGKLVMTFSVVLGWLGLLAGGIWGLVDIIREPVHPFTHKTV